MSFEYKLLAACIHSRDAFVKLEDNLEDRIETPMAELILKLCKRYYTNDASAQRVDIDFLTEHISTMYDSQKKVDAVIETVKEINALDVSSINIVDLILAQQRKNKAHELAIALTNDSENIREMIEKFNGLLDKQESVDVSEVYCGVTAEETIASVLDERALIKLPTKALNEKLDGGCQLGHHVVVFARPETGKTAFCTSVEYAMACQELSGIYFGNEDPIKQLILRSQTCFSGMSKEQIKANPAELNKRLNARNWKSVKFIPLHPGNPYEITKYVKMYKPKWVIVDQIRNLNVKADTRVNQMEAAATFMRNLAGQYNLLAFSVTQAGDSADNKLALSMGDIDFSNTGIPAQADLMIGIGVNEAQEKQGLRTLSLPKNKISGKHDHFAVRINPQLSRIEDI